VVREPTQNLPSGPWVKKRLRTAGLGGCVAHNNVDAMKLYYWIGLVFPGFWNTSVNSLRSPSKWSLRLGLVFPLGQGSDDDLLANGEGRLHVPSARLRRGIPERHSNSTSTSNDGWKERRRKDDETKHRKWIFGDHQPPWRHHDEGWSSDIDLTQPLGYHADRIGHVTSLKYAYSLSLKCPKTPVSCFQFYII